MTCDQADLRMAELLCGEIAAEDRGALEKHLLECETCRDDYELARVGARVEWADVPVPAELIESTRAAFREPGRGVRFLRAATAAAAVFCVAALLLTSGRRPAPVDQAPMACQAPRPERLASMQDAIVGALVCTDESGRPVGELGLQSHSVSVEIQDGIAKTTVEENFENHTDKRLEGQFQFPLPPDASISRLALEVNGKIEEGTCLERERAREVFESIVSRMKDPALLEWQPGGFFKCRIFPIEPRATKRVIVAYTQALPYFRGKMTYVYPLVSEKTRTHPPETLSLDVVARFNGALTKIESPSHHLEVRRKNASEASLSYRATRYRPNNDFVVTLEPAEEEVRVVSHKPDGEDGYFACFVTPRGVGERASGSYTFVLDASASVSAPRLDVAKRLVRAMMERRIEGDRFEILSHNVDVEASGDVDLRRANDFMDRIRPIGGSDLLKALQAVPADREIIYVGKGAPSFGETEASKILAAMKGRRIRTIAVGSDANLGLLEKLGGLMQVSPNDDVPNRVAEIAATLGSPRVFDLRIESEAIQDVVGLRDLFYGERLVAAGRYRGTSAKLTISGSGYSREIDVVFPAKEEGNNYVRRLWAQRKVSDLLAQGPEKKAEVTEMGVKYQIMTPFTSFLVLENEQMWKDHQLKREVQKQDQVLGKGAAEAESAAQEIKTKREVTRRMAELLQQSYSAWEERRYGKTMTLCDEILQIDPQYPVAQEMRGWAEKARHTDDPFGTLSRKVQELKRVTDSGEAAVIPQSQTVRFPSREEWAEISKRLSSSVQVQASTPEMEKIAQELARGRSDIEQKKIYESQRHYELALMHKSRGDFDKAKIESQKAIEGWYENLAARKLLNEINQAAFGGRDDFRVRIEQAQIEITKHVRDGERYLNARMYEQARKEFENAEFKIQNIPYEVRAMNELLPLVKDSIVKARNARILEDLRVEEMKHRVAEAEAVAQPTRAPASGSEWEELLNKLKANYAVTEQQKATQADEHYRLAERYFQAADFEKSTLETQRALQLSPNHAPSRALFTETQFILGQGKATPTTVEYDKFMHEALVRHQQTLVEIDSTYERGKRAYNQGDLAQAEREFRKVTEFAKWMPTGVEVETRRKAALDMLQRAQAGGRQMEVDGEKTRLRFVEEEGARNDFRVVLQPDRGVLFDQALKRFEGEDFRGAVEDADRLLQKNPNDLAVLEMRNLAQRFQHMKRGADVNLRQLTNEWKRPYEPMELNAAIQADRLDPQPPPIFSITGNVAAPGAPITDALPILADIPLVGSLFPGKEDSSKEVWGELTGKRQPKGIAAIDEVAQEGANITVWPKKPLEAKVRAYVPEFGLVVMTIGKDDGVVVGDEFTVYRGGDFVAKIVIDRTDHRWAAGKIVLKKQEPRINDDVSNHIFVSADGKKVMLERITPDRASYESVQRIRAKMGLKE